MEAAEARKSRQNSALRNANTFRSRPLILEPPHNWTVFVCAGSSRRRTLRNALLSCQSLTQRRSFPRPLCRVWPPHREQSWPATARKDATPRVRVRNSEMTPNFRSEQLISCGTKSPHSKSLFFLFSFACLSLFLTRPSPSRPWADWGRPELPEEKDSSPVQLQLRAQHPQERRQVWGRHIYLRQSRYDVYGTYNLSRDAEMAWRWSDGLFCETRSRRRGSPGRIGQGFLLVSAQNTGSASGPRHAAVSWPWLLPLR